MTPSRRPWLLSPIVLDTSARSRGALHALSGASAAVEPSAALLARDLAEVLTQGAVDFGDLARRWVRRWQEGTVRFDPATDRAVRHLADAGRPPGLGQPGHSLVGLPLAIPVTLATFRSPRALLGTVYHTVRLTTADERTTWGAVAIGVAAAQFLLARSDFIPDVVEALSVNAAPPGLLAAIRRVPVLRLNAGESLGSVAEDEPTRTVVGALWAAYREPNATRAAGCLMGPNDGICGHGVVAAAALLAARDGQDRIPAAWTPAAEDVERWSDLADRLTTPDTFRSPDGTVSAQAASENSS